MLRAIQVVIEVPDDLAVRSAAFWSAALGWPLGPIQHGRDQHRSFAPADAPPYVHLRVADVGTPRVNIDVEVDDLDADADRLVELGASRVAPDDRRPVMASPGGLAFGVVDHRPGATPAPVAFDGHRTRLVQVCIDAPVDRFEHEVAFWREATGWAWSGSDATEFAGKLRPAPNRVQILLQRLTDHSGRVRSHIDLGTDDRCREVSRLAALGAEPGAVGAGWQVMLDPVGMVFCVTDNPPR